MGAPTDSNFLTLNQVNVRMFLSHVLILYLRTVGELVNQCLTLGSVSCFTNDVNCARIRIRTSNFLNYIELKTKVVRRFGYVC